MPYTILVKSPGPLVGVQVFPSLIYLSALWRSFLFKWIGFLNLWASFCTVGHLFHILYPVYNFPVRHLFRILYPLCNFPSRPPFTTWLQHNNKKKWVVKVGCFCRSEKNILGHTRWFVLEVFGSLSIRKYKMGYLKCLEMINARYQNHGWTVFFAWLSSVLGKVLLS